MYLGPDPDNVVHASMDGEVLVIRSDTGAYYSLRQSAATIWSALVSPAEPSEVRERAARHHGIDPADIADAVAAFLDELRSERLITEVPSPEPAPDAALPAETAGEPWTVPQAVRYDDMRDLLLFDPIHEVQPTGWPDVQPSDHNDGRR